MLKMACLLLLFFNLFILNVSIKVFLAQEKETQSYYALKVIKKDKLLIHHSVHKIFIERNIFAQGSGSPFVANLRSTFTTPVSTIPTTLNPRLFIIHFHNIEPRFFCNGVSMWRGSSISSTPITKI